MSLMKVEKRNIKRHLFICTNERPAGLKDSCGPKDAKGLIQNIKLRLREDGLWDQFKITGCGCLGPCEEGISAVIYPDNELITNLTLEKEDELYAHLTRA